MEYIEDPESNDSPSMSHLMLQEQRIVRYYLRLIEHEMPHLAGMSIHLFLPSFLVFRLTRPTSIKETFCAADV
jgi:hypothetical protein